METDAQEPAPVLRAPSQDECQSLRRMAEATFEYIRSTELSAAGSVAGAHRLTLLESAIDEAIRWFDAGCPDHPVLGMYDYEDGTGGVVRFIDWPPEEKVTWFGED